MSKTDKARHDQLALDYHSQGKPGKIEIRPTKAFITSNDLSLAYTPGVAAPCLEIAKDPAAAYKYTAKGNLVGVISNGSAVLGLGNIGALAGKPVMEGKGILFKRFADIDVFDIEVNEDTVDGMVKIVKSLEPTFGGINLEDIKAPECFEIEAQLIEQCNIPIFHDDQHGTAIIATAAFLNALEITKRKIENTKIVFSGAGAAAMSCAKLFYAVGAKPENLLMCDSKGVIYKGRKEGMNKYKDQFAVDSKHRTMLDALKGADAFIGCSARGVLSKEMVKSMGKEPIIFAMANPEPEIYPYEVAEVRDDAIMATGRSDFHNQVNNVLGFPFIFRGALDVRATTINLEMKLAAVYALADLAKKEVTEEVKLAYNGEDFSFGKNYLIPKPFDTRVLTTVTPAVAKAAIDSGVAQKPIENLADYASNLENRLNNTAAFMSSIREGLNHATQESKVRMLFAEGSNSRVLQVAKTLLAEKRIQPVLLGSSEEVHSKMKKCGLYEELKEIEIITPEQHPSFKEFSKEFSLKKQRSGISENYAKELMGQENYFGSLLVKKGLADTLICGPTLNYPECLRPVLQVIGTKNHQKASGIFILVYEDRLLFLADTTVQIDPNSEELSEIALATAELYKLLMGKDPRIAFLSFSNFGSNNHPKAKKVKEAVALTKKLAPNLMIDGEMQADVAVNHMLMDKLFHFSKLDSSADILIFPDLSSANIAYKLLSQLSETKAIGPLLTPLNNTVNIIPQTASVSEIVNMANLTALLSRSESKP